MDYTSKLAEFCSGITMENLPPEVIAQAKLCLLDYAANVYGSLELRAVKDVASYIKSLGGAPRATAHGCSFKTDVHHAAFMNGTSAEAVEAQDGYRFGGSHPGTAVIPAVLAVGEDIGCSGPEIVEAVVAGYEVAGRIAAATHPWQTMSGFLPTGTCGAFGAAAAVARLKRFDEQMTLNALGNAGYLLPLCMAEQLMGGFTIKIVQGGQAASTGIMAAGLAGQGITGAPHVLEGSSLNGGFAQITTGGKAQLTKLIDTLGEPYAIMDIYFKPYTACRHTHGSAQAVLELSKERYIDPDEIDSIEVYTYGMAHIAVGKGLNEQKSFVSAQFSLPYVVSVCLLDGELGPNQLTENRIKDPRVSELIGKIKVNVDEELNSVYPGMTSSRVEISLKSGDKLVRQVDIPKGDPRFPLGEKELIEKVKRFAGDRDSSRLDTVIEYILGLDKLSSISELVELI